MNARRVLVASLLLNAALGVLAWQLARVELPVARAASHSPLPTRVRRLPAVPVVPPRTPAPAPAKAVPNSEVAMAAFHWSQVESDDYERYVANLRAIGCPEQTLRDIIFADVDELYLRQFRDVLRPVWQNYWDILAGGADEHPMFKAADERMDKLKDERRDLLDRLLDTNSRDASESKPAVSIYETVLADVLPPERKQQLAEIEARYQPFFDAASRDGPEREKRQAEVRKQREAEQFAALTPAEQAEWRLRDTRIVEQLDRMSSTLIEEELRAVAALQAEAGKANEDSAQVSDRIRGVIGEERFADYQRSQDAEYHSLVQIGRRLDLPTATLIQADDMRRAAQNQAKAVEANGQLSPEEKSALRSTIHRETTQALGSTLGEQGLKAYRSHGGGWLDKFVKP